MSITIDDNQLVPIIDSEEESKGLDSDRKRLHWEAYAKKTERQEEVFKKVFDSVFEEQKKQVAEHLQRTGNLPIGLNDEETAKRFEAALRLTYEDAFESAV